MKQFSTKILFSMLMSMIGVNALADTFSIDGLTYEPISSTEASLISASTNVINVIVPNQVTNESKTYNVVSLAEKAFYKCQEMSSISLPNTIKIIGKEVFRGCSSLKTITIPEGITEIREGTFRRCESLESIIIPESVSSIDERAFMECYSLTSVTIPNSVTSLGKQLFYDCFSLTSVTIPNSVTSLGDYMFYNCSSLTSVTIPNGLTSIEKSMFFGCNSLKTISIPNGVTTISENAFNGCTSLSTITIPNNVTTIGKCAFYDCTGLTSINIPNSVTTISDDTFYNCTSLSSIKIPNSVTTIGGAAFFCCTSLTSIKIPSSVTTIGFSAFYGCNRLESAFIDCVDIDNWFHGLESLREIVIGNDARSIDRYAFSGCTNLASVTLPNSLTSIGSRIFDGCASLTSIYSKIETPFDVSWTGPFTERDYKEATLYVPIGTSSLYKNTKGWKDFKNIVEMYYGEETEETDDDGEESADSKLTIHVATAGSLSDIIPDNEKYQIEELTLTGEINGEDFRLLRNMAGKGTVFGNSFFDADTEGKLSVLDLSGAKIVAGGEYMRWDDGIDNDFGYYLIHDDEIPPSVFSGCIGLNSIIIPDNISVIGQSAFYGTSWYESQPDGITYIGKVAYAYKGDMPENTQLTIKDGTLSIACSAFGGCKNLASITIPNSVSVIGGIGEVAGPQDYYGAFKNCIGLTSITIPNNVTILGKYTFDGCTALRSIKIGSGIKEIGDNAFANILKINETTRSDEDYLHIYCEAEVVPTISPYVFSGTDISRVILHVPDNLIDEYKATETWSEIGTIEGLSETGINAIRYDVSKVQIFDLQGNKLDHVHKGLNIIRMNDGKVKKIFVK